jgi:hypothetical protein
MVRDGAIRVLLANMSPDRARVEVGPLPGPIVRVRSLDAGSIPEAVASPPFHVGTVDELHIMDGRARVDMAALAYVRIDTVVGDAVRSQAASAGPG